MTAHLAILPLLLPLAAGALLVALAGASQGAQRAVGALATAGQLVVAIVLVGVADDGERLAYAVSDWAAPFGIFLVVDRLAAWMLLVTALVAAPALLYSFAGEDREGPYFHALFQFQLLGINGAFLTADLFNLFVFFEVLLISSYALLMHGPNRARTQAAVHVVTLNLLGSLLFLLAVGCIYAATGTLGLADLALKAPAVAATDAGLLQAGSLLLLVVFALKAAAIPLGFWLPGAYGAAPAAAAALFAVLTKVGAYAILRLYSLAFPCFDAGPCGPSALVLPLGLLTLLFASIGAIAAARLRALSGYLVLLSVGTLLVAIGTFREVGYVAAVYYLAHGTFASAALFLVADLVARQRGAAGDALAAAAPVREPVLLGLLYAVAAIAIVGLPPLSGFLGKLAVLRATGANFESVWVIVLASSLVAVVVAARAASALFWRTGDAAAAGPVGARSARAAAGGFALLVVALTVAAGPAFDYAAATARQLLDRRGYVDAVFEVRSKSAPLPAQGAPADPGERIAGETNPVEATP